MAKPANPQVGGWYDGQQWDGTRYGAPGQIIVGSGSSGGNSGTSYDKIFGEMSGEVNKYVDDLINQAQGDYNYAAKVIENNFKLAVGKDDNAAKEFLKKVSNALEDKVGRIQFDYDTGSYRLNEDADLATTRTNRAADTALTRLAEDEELDRRGLLRENLQLRRDQEASLNERGILSTPRDSASGLAGREVRELEEGIGDRMAAFERQLARNREDIGTNRTDTLYDIGLERNRGLEDLTTAARRGVIDETNERDYNLESAQRALDRRKAELEAERRRSLNQARSLANASAIGAY
jgi:hypothetical protein